MIIIMVISGSHYQWDIHKNIFVIWCLKHMHIHTQNNKLDKQKKKIESNAIT